MTEEQALAQATQNIENAKPMLKQLGNNEIVEYSEEDYAQAIIDNKNFILDQANNGWLYNRKEHYPSIEDCIHALLDGGDTLTDLQAARQLVKDTYPKPT